MVHEIYVLRHAAPDRGSGITYNVPPGPPLTAIGRKEALQAATYLRETAAHIDVAYVSPFARTRQTATIVSEHLSCPFAYVESLKEGAPGESHPQVRERVSAFLQELDQREVKRVLLVTHGCCVLATLQLTTADTIDLRGHTYDYGNQSPTAGIWHGVRNESGLYDWELVFKPTVLS